MPLLTPDQEKQFNLTLINVLSENGDVFFRQVKSREIGTKYKLVKGQGNLYELSKPKCTKQKQTYSGGISDAVSKLFLE